MEKPTIKIHVGENQIKEEMDLVAIVHKEMRKAIQKQFDDPDSVLYKILSYE